MSNGAPDYVHLRQILARDALGNLVPVACDPSGRIILLPYGTQTVSQDDPTRTIQGADGLDLYTIAVDAAGRLIMLPYGWDGATYRPLKVDAQGRMIGVFRGERYDILQQLKLWFTCQGPGNTLEDQSGEGHDAVVYDGANPGATYCDGVVGNALRLDGSDDYAITPEFALTAIDRTFECWVYNRGSASYEGIFMQSSSLANTQGKYVNGFFFKSADPNQFYLCVGDGVNSDILEDTLPVDMWIHLVGIIRGGKSLTIYQNGVETATIATTYNPETVVRYFIIGCQGIKYADIDIDEVRVYNRALSANEVLYRYNYPTAQDESEQRTVKVDNWGRLMVNMQDLPYKDRILEHKDMHLAPGGGVNLYSSYVPEGKAWILTSVLAYTDTADCDSIDIGIYDGSENYILSYIRGAGTCQKVFNYGELILRAGDRINVAFTGLPLNAYIVLNINGYKLDAP